MLRRKRKPPKYCLHKSSGQAVVYVDCKATYLDMHESPESHEAYAHLVAVWTAKTSSQRVETARSAERLALGRGRVSERRVCKTLNQPRSTQRRKKHVPSDEPRLMRRRTQLAYDYGRYGYRRITALLRAEDWRVNHKRIERLWRQEGLKFPHKQPKRRRLWLNNGSCVRLRPAYKDHVLRFTGCNRKPVSSINTMLAPCRRAFF